MKKSKQAVTKTISVPPDAAWKVIGGVGDVDKWLAPLIQKCRVEGNKRYLTTEGGSLEEDILEVNHSNRVLRYGIPKQPIIPVENIFGTVKVLDAGEQHSTIEWSAEFDVLPEKEAEAKAVLQQLYTMGIQGIENYINSRN
jgi:Polyketide cyclase / dehydrase and lipid transport